MRKIRAAVIRRVKRLPKKDIGRKDDAHKLRYDLLPTDAIAGLVAVLTHGAAKYEPRNWENGIVYSRVYAALQRHLNAFWNGEDVDADSGLPTIDHAMACLLFLSAYSKRKMKKFDDRPL